MLPKSFFDASITLVPKPDKGHYKKGKLHTKHEFMIHTHESQTQYQDLMILNKMLSKRIQQYIEKDNTL